MRAMMMMMPIVSVMLLYTKIAGGASLSKPGCPDTCGNNVTIPYPFGIGPGCSANDFFRVSCSNTSSPPKPFLDHMSLEALEFSIDRKVVRLLQRVFPINCSTETVILVGKTVSRRNTPFSYSTLYNRLVVIGCGNEVRVLNYNTTRPSYGGCNPICGPSTPSCNGINCCHTSVPSQYEEAEVFYNSKGNGAAGGVCGYTFLSDRRWLERDYLRYLRLIGNETSPLNLPPDTAVPLILEWELEVSNATASLQGVKCDNRSISVEASLDDDASNLVNTTRCYCVHGFEGNPYLPDGGCRDIDECSNRELNICAAPEHCVNAVGGFGCKDPNNGGDMKSTVVGISSATGGLILLGGIWIFSKVVRRRIKANRKKKFYKQNGGILLEQKLSSNKDGGGGEKITLFSSKELALATDRYNENRVLGRGGQGTVYKGMLPDGRIVAVKKSKKMEQSDIEAFINEVVIVSQIRHRNVVRLLGCCLETEVPLLVYEFVPNGTLFEHIHDEEFPLSWTMRVRIAAEGAAALAYLHYAASAPIYHRDVKSTNILLDEKYRAKVSDFGTSRSVDLDQTHVTTRVMGTFGYLDPEYFQSNQFTEKSDVYSFGVVVVELLTGEKAVSAVRADVGRSLAAHFLQSMEENRVFDILDPKVLKEGRREEVAAVARLARRCLHLKGKSRPTMKEVAAELEAIRAMEDGPILQLQHEDMGFHSIEVGEDYNCNFSSVTDSMTFNSSITTAESSDFPLLFGNS